MRSSIERFAKGVIFLSLVGMWNAHLIEEESGSRTDSCRAGEPCWTTLTVAYI